MPLKFSASMFAHVDGRLYIACACEETTKTGSVGVPQINTVVGIFNPDTLEGIIFEWSKHIKNTTFISSDYDLETTISKIDESSADYIHVDMMDGNFVEACNFGPQEIKKMYPLNDELREIKRKNDIFKLYFVLVFESGFCSALNESAL